VDDVTGWHGTAETLARVTRRDDGLLDVVLPVGLWPADGGPVEVRVDGIALALTEVTEKSIRESLEGATDQLERLRRVRESVDLDQALARRPQNRYFEARTHLAEGPTTVTVHGVQHRYFFADPVWTREDLWHTERPYGLGHDHWYQQWWALLVQPGVDVDHVRVDLLDTVRHDDPEDLPNVTIEVQSNDGAVRSPSFLPLVDRNRDSITWSIPQEGHGPVARVKVSVNSRSSGWISRGPARATQFMLFNYCIQGLNDLFTEPVTDYDPPRTYMQVTASDEKALYCSRPAAREDGEPDGYALTLDAHRKLGVKSHWAFNAGVLLLVQHDCPEFLADLREAVRTGLVSATNAGYGAHRPHYYALETNVQEIRLGRQVIENVLGAADDVYYPDQRLYNATPQEIGAFAANDVQFLVLDRSTACDATPAQLFPDEHRLGGNQVLFDDTSGRRVLLIEDEVREQFVAANDSEIARGKLPLNLRRLFLDHTTPAEGGDRRPLLVYGDDADKASGNGWFDGDYDGGRGPWASRQYLAALLWLSEHPWVDVVTTADLDDGGEPVVNIASASCPSVDPGGASTVEAYGAGHLLHFDSWFDAWRRHSSPWLGRTLGELDDELQTRLCTGESDTLSWAYYLMNTHESFWNKEPLENTNTNAANRVMEPEDFVIAEGLQSRNAWVFLEAARWALSQPGHATRVRTVNWDRDRYPNIIVFNDRVLLVCDRNGGRITHLFTRRGSEAVSVSGTHKAYQFYDPTTRTVCDGDVLQNTVFTPNHAYVATDVAQSAWRRGKHVDPRLGEVDWLYPDNFNAYPGKVIPSGVRFVREPAGTPWPEEITDAVFREACREDGTTWRDGPGFAKTIRLRRNVITVEYTRTSEGHLVANEFCLDLATRALGQGLQEVVGSRITGPRDTAVEVACVQNCSHVETVRRVLTDDVRIRSDADGGFRYTITID